MNTLKYSKLEQFTDYLREEFVIIRVTAVALSCLKDTREVNYILWNICDHSAMQSSRLERFIFRNAAMLLAKRGEPCWYMSKDFAEWFNPVYWHCCQCQQAVIKPTRPIKAAFLGVIK